jgi:gluconate 2-dehydrogenase gamma chain
VVPETHAHRVTVSRRAAVRALGAGIGGAAVWPYLSDSAAEAFAAIQATDAPPALAFLSSGQYATVDALVETIIPADASSPGAHAARVADYIDLLLAESDDDMRQRWIAGVTALDGAAQSRFQTPFATLSAPQAIELLATLARNELAPTTSLEHFFVLSKDATIRGYYTSEIGIHQELQYQGNRVIGEFVGCTHPEHGYTP